MRSFVNWVHSLAYVVRGAHAMRMGDDDAVIRHYSRAIEISPEDLDYYYARGHAHWHKREYGLAAADFTRAIELNPDDMYAHFVRGAIYRDRGFVAQAIMDLTFVIDVGDEIPLAHYLRASCYAERKDFDKALADLEVALRRDPYNERTLELKAECARQAASLVMEK